MELPLNIVWVALAAAVGACAIRNAFAADREQSRSAVLALVCVVTLLFPIISISDDLHFDPAVDESAARRRDGTGGLTAPNAAAQAHAAVLVAACAIEPDLAIIGESFCDAVPLTLAIDVLRTNPRSPPGA